MRITPKRVCRLLLFVVGPCWVVGHPALLRCLHHILLRVRGVRGIRCQTIPLSGVVALACLRLLSIAVFSFFKGVVTFRGRMDCATYTTILLLDSDGVRITTFT